MNAPVKPDVLRPAAEPSTASTPAESGFKGTLDTSNVLTLLFERALPTLTKDEQEWLVDEASELAGNLAHDNALMIDRIGVLVEYDAGSDVFQSQHHVPLLLFHFGENFRQIHGLLQVAYLASKNLERGVAS